MAEQMRPHGVQLHSHDFEWADLAHECQRTEAEQEEGHSGSESAVAVIDDGRERCDTQQLAKEARDKWDVFHQRHNGRVYRPRNYLVTAFPELCAPERNAVDVLELGCGYGSAIFPILATYPNVRAQVCDFSAHAIRMLEQHADYDAARCRAFVCDIVQEELVGVPRASIDIVLMVFVLSALPPESFARTLQKVYAVLRPGGIVCFRDYGLYDLAMRRNAKKLGPNLYYRSDGTLAYFFSRETLVQLFEQAGFRTLEATYCTVRLRNRRKGVTMDRVWLHAKLEKPGAEGSSSKA
ncbi:unnamed protein product [Hyaloperonospora brassicae]|uniref:tRNA N(3)-methylcytidine methyltransferase n=1 Tax=Hyaloperonospora brassicae TaxID=162125 RepID=A0AAV0V0E7_HYABA|nr:unnamed protein product [Hyaloperonospora brassicae]